MADPTIQVKPFFGNDTGPTFTVTFDDDLTTGSSVIVYFAGFANDPGVYPPSLDVDGTAATLDVESTSGGGSYTQIWRAVGVVGGGADVTITHGGPLTNYVVGVAQEVAGSAALEASNVGYDNSSGATRSITSAGGSPAVDDLVVALIDIAASSLQAGWTEAFNSTALGSGMTGQGIYRQAVATGNQTATFTGLGAGNTDISVAVYRITAGGPSFNAAWAAGSNQVIQ